MNDTLQILLTIKSTKVNMTEYNVLKLIATR